MFDGDGPGTGECAQTTVPQLPAAGVLTQKQKMEGHEGNCEKLLHFDVAGRIMLSAMVFMFTGSKSGPLKLCRVIACTG